MKMRNIFEIIFYKSFTDIKAEAARSYLGLLWWIIEPIMYLFTFYVLFVLILKRGGPNFVPNFLCGVVVWKWFASAINGGAYSISTHRGLLQQVYVPKFIFPIIAVLGSTVRFLPVFAIFIIFLLFYGIPFQVEWITVFVLIFVQFGIVVSLSMLVGAVTPFLPDLKPVIDNGLMMLFFLSGVLYDINAVHEPLKSYLLLNPMARLIVQYREVMIQGGWPDYSSLVIIFSASVAIGLIALILFKQLDDKYGKVRF